MRVKMRALVLGTALVMSAGCAPESLDTDAFQATGGIEPGSLFAKGVVRVANELAGNDLLTKVGLSQKAVDNILYYRTGDDGLVGTADDETFGDILELDAVPFVDPTAFAKLLSYAIQNGYTGVFGDQDGDGVAAPADCDDANPQIHPGAFDILFSAAGTADGVDDDCDGAIDEVDCVALDPTVPAAALDFCDSFASSPAFAADPRSVEVRTSFGPSYLPQAGADFVALSTGIVAVPGEEDYIGPQSGQTLHLVSPHPFPEGAVGCSGTDGAEVFDQSEVSVTLNVPANAKGLAYDLNFISAEFPEFVCSTFDDTFLALIVENGATRNVAVDATGMRMSVNNGKVTHCAPVNGGSCLGDESLIGTGYEGTVGGGTGWLTNSASVTPGSVVTLRFILFDEGDHILDSTVLLDGFRWLKNAPPTPEISVN